MAEFPGLCERCGGPKVWTAVGSEVYTACKADCLDDQLDFFGRNPPLIALCEKPEQTPKMEHSREGGVVPPEGADFKESTDDDLPF